MVEKRVCLLTGAAGRLGTEFCRRYADVYQIAAVYRKREPSVASQRLRFVDPLNPHLPLAENAQPVFAIQADLSTSAGLRAVVEQALSQFGRIDVLVNAATHSVWGPMLSSPQLLESAARQFQLNVTVPLELSVLLARHFWNRAADQNRAQNCNIVNVSSIAGNNVYTGSGQSVYAASKAALNHLSRHMANEFKTLGVRVNAIAPNSFPAIVPTGRVAEGIVQLDSGDMTGKILVLDAARPSA